MLPKGSHRLEIRWVNQDPAFRIYLRSYVVYSDEPLKKYVPGEQQAVK
jgi:hypothetical protein